MNKYENLKNIVAAMDADVQKFYNGNAAAGTRVRKALQDVKKAAQEFRIEVQELKAKNK
ncbi:MAG: histone H1 [Bacteroidetes bacterium]|nr:histone H1 [Bacteroidota bacterium]MBL7893024.1 histone H1 [Bacteroidia bacterium]